VSPDTLDYSERQLEELVACEVTIEADLGGKQRAFLFAPTEGVYRVVYKRSAYKRWYLCPTWEYATLDNALAWFGALVARAHHGGEFGMEMPGWNTGVPDAEQ